MRIKPQAEYVVLRVKLPAELHEQLERYRALLGQRTRMDYVVTEALRSFLAGDKDFRRAVAERPARKEKPKAAPTPSVPKAALP